MAVFANFVGPSYTVQSPNADCERVINLMPEIMESPGAKARVVYVPAPGFDAFATLDGFGRQLFGIDGRAWTVDGATLKELVNGGAPISRGAVPIDTFPPTMASSGDAGRELAIASGGSVYILNLDTNVLALGTSDRVDLVGYLDGTFIGLDTASSILRASDPLDGLTWNALSIYQRDSAPDRWQSLIVVNGDVWAFGSETSDVLFNAGTSPFPLAVRTTIPTGIAARASVAILDNAPAWLAQTSQGSRFVVRASGYGPPQRISTHAVEVAIEGYDSISDATAWSYQKDGHTFYVLRFPSARATWVYDAATQLWHERPFWNRTTGQWEAYRASSHCYAFGKHLVTDAQSAAIFELTDAHATDMDGHGIRRVRRAPHLLNEQRRVLYRDLQLDLDVGVGAVTGQGDDPQVMLRWSNDAGRTFGNEHWTSAGARGAYRTRVLWSRLGSARDRVFEVVMSDPVPWRISAAYLNAETAAH